MSHFTLTEGTFSGTVGASALSATRVGTLGYAITYNDIDNSLGKFTIISPTGTEVLAPTTIFNGAMGFSAAAILNNGNIFIAFEDDVADSGRFVIYNQSGTQVVAPTEFDSIASSVTATTLGNGKVLIVYTSSGGVGESVIYNEDGSLAQSAVQFAAAAQGFVKVATLSNGNGVVAYATAFPGDLHVAEISQTDATVVNDFTTGTANSAYSRIQVEVMENGNYIVAHGTTDGGSNLYRTFNSSNSLIHNGAVGGNGHFSVSSAGDNVLFAYDQTGGGGG